MTDAYATDLPDLCDAAIRPFAPVNVFEIRCDITGPTHDRHQGTILDYAHPGSKTSISWFESDRRNFHGAWPGDCHATQGCILPEHHRGSCQP